MDAGDRRHFRQRDRPLEFAAEELLHPAEPPGSAPFSTPACGPDCKLVDERFDRERTESISGPKLRIELPSEMSDASRFDAPRRCKDSRLCTDHVQRLWKQLANQSVHWSAAGVNVRVRDTARPDNERLGTDPVPLSPDALVERARQADCHAGQRVSVSGDAKRGRTPGSRDPDPAARQLLVLRISSQRKLGVDHRG